LLRVAPHATGLRLACTTFDETGAPIEYTEAFYPSEQYDMQFTLRVK